MTDQTHKPTARLCQIQSIPTMKDAGLFVEEKPLPLISRLKLTLKRRLNSNLKRMIKTKFNNLILWLSKRTSEGQAIDNQLHGQVYLNLKANDLVRIRSKEEIKKTLDHWNELKGCGFMADMWKYCGSEQRVLTPVGRFVDERDYKIKAVRGVVLLEGLICKGTELFGKCDRACFFFWREEWLEKIKET